MSYHTSGSMSRSYGGGYGTIQIDFQLSAMKHLVLELEVPKGLVKLQWRGGEMVKSGQKF